MSNLPTEPGGFPQQERETLVGRVELDEKNRRRFVPFDPRLPFEAAIQGGGQLGAGTYVVAELEPKRKRSAPAARPRVKVLEELGPVEVPGVDIEVILRHHRIPYRFPAHVLRMAAEVPSDPRPGDWAGREDLRGQVVVTIDGESARDFDDALSIERLPGGIFRLAVHIADVAACVPEGSALDLEAFRRGTSVYFPERAIPMLPEEISNGLCSLRPHATRLTVSAFLDIDRDGRVLACRFAETVIRSARRMTYSEVRRLLLEPAPDDGALYGDILPALREMHHLMEILHHARTVRGSIDFDLPEGNVELDTDGTMVGVLPEERSVAHRLVEEFMIAANEAVAGELVRRGVPGLFRVHQAPNPERLAELRDLLRPLGLELPGELVDLPPKALQEVLQQVAGKPEEHFVSSVVLRTMQRAVYRPECLGHYALASPRYTHFTSPIRRYPDLVVHRQLKTLLAADGRAAGGPAGTVPPLAERLAEIGEHASATEKRAEQAERDLLQWKKVRFLAGRTGERFHGRITGVQPFGLFVQLEPYYVGGLVPIRTLGDDYYVFEPESHRLVGEQRGRVFQLADPVEVELVGVDLRHRGLDLVLIGTPIPPPRRRAAAGAAGGRGAGRAREARGKAGKAGGAPAAPAARKAPRPPVAPASAPGAAPRRAAPSSGPPEPEEAKSVAAPRAGALSGKVRRPPRGAARRGPRGGGARGGRGGTPRAPGRSR